MIDSDVLDPAVQLAPRVRPQGRPAGYHRWHDLLFVHWRLPGEVLQPFVPQRLQLDTWDGDAWLGIVAFRMSGVRPRWFPAIPGVASFLETNLRTYVHLDGRAPGVLFLSLDAAHRLAVRIARWRWRLPYFHARMSIAHSGDRVEYESFRDARCPAGRTHFVARIGGNDESSELEPRPAAPSTLEFFLAERYFMYVPQLGSQGDDLWRGQVHHTPYELTPAELLVAEESLSAAAGLPGLPTPCHAMFSPGVRVEVFALKPLH